MGPYPHDAPPAVISESNPAGTDGFEFVEFSHPDLGALHALFETMGLVRVAQHKRKAVSLWRQGEINFLASGEPQSHAAAFAVEHGPCAASMAWRVVDAEHAFAHAVAAGAEPFDARTGATTVDAPAIRGIGGSLLYFIERQAEGTSAYDREFDWVGERDAKPAGLGLHYIDHLTHNVKRGRMNDWSGFYEKLFGFKQIRFFDIEGKHTGLFSRAMTSPCGKIRIPINESADAHSQIEEYLREYKGEGIQHVACGSSDIYASVDALA
jgi:4-hydroxyphenylpyruvate dioxygenase